MDVAKFIIIFVGLISFVRTSDIPTTCESPTNTAERESQDFPYIGCYESACLNNTPSFTISTINECTGACKNKSSTFAALAFGDTCYCREFDCIYQSDAKRCDDRCGIPCGGNLEPLSFCGGREFIQVYQDITDDTNRGEDDSVPRLRRWLIPFIGAVLSITVAFPICFGLGLAGRRKRRHDERQRPVHQGDFNQTSNVEMTSLNAPDRRCRQNNQYSVFDCRHLNPSNTSTGSTPPPVEMQLSSDNTYDHIASRDRILANAGNSKPPPRFPAPRSHPGPFPHDHNCQDVGDVFSGLSCAEIGSGADCSGRPNAEQLHVLTYEMASTSPSYFTLETSENETNFEEDSQLGMKARRGNLEGKPSFPPEKNAEDDSSLYAYATCSDQSMDRRFYRKLKESKCQEDDDYHVISDTQN